MTLTPEDVRNKTFTPVRLREGYDMGEVDAFLDEVEVELTRLLQENDGLRSEPSNDSDVTSAVGGRDAAARVDSDAAGKVTPHSIPEAAGAAARLLEIATSNADQLVSEAREDADRIVKEATAEAERLRAEAKATAERLRTEAQARAQRLDTETAQRKQDLLGGLEKDKEELNSEIGELKAFEREYRSRLRSYFESQLRALEGQLVSDVATPPSTDESASPGLRQIMAEGGEQ
jgi:DivIVA domain-containing protein